MADSNPAFVYCPGPVHVFVRVPQFGPGQFNINGTLSGSESIAYLGTTEVAPEIDMVDVWAPVHSAIGGEVVPFDEMYQGRMIEVRLDLLRRSETVLTAIANSPRFGRESKTDDGDEPVGNVGTMLVTNRMGFQLWLVSTHWLFGVSNLLDYPDLKPGFFFPCVRCGRMYKGREGLMPSKAYLELSPRRVYDAYNRKFIQYSTQATRFVGLPNPL